MKNLLRVIIVIATLPLVLFLIAAPFVACAWLFSGASLDGDAYRSEYMRQNAGKRSEVVQMWYDRQNLDLTARRQCLEDPKCDYFKLRPADNFMSGDTFQPKPWEQKFDITIRNKKQAKRERKIRERKPSTKFSRQMGRIPEEDKTWLRKMGEHPTVDYWLGNGFGH